MRVILSANIPHYVYAASALQHAGYLQRYICAAGIRDEPSWLRLLPLYWQRKLRGRDISEIDETLTKSLWLPEILQKGLPRLRLLSQERGNWLNNYLYDLLARRHVAACDVFHFVSSIGLYSAQRARSLGAILVCDERTEYPDYQRSILNEENGQWGVTQEIPGRMYNGKIKQEYALADYIILPSTYAKRTFVDAGFDADRIFVVPYGVDRRYFDRETKTAAASSPVFRVIYAGQMIPRKGVHYLLEAFQQLHLPSSELILLGRVDESMRATLQAAARNNPQIKLMGSVPKVELRHTFNRAAVFVLPSLADSWGLVVSEAMACGLPVIVTENVGSREIVRDSVDGFVVPIRNAAAIKEKLQLLYQAPALRQQMADAAYHQAQAFTWARYQQQLLAVYAEIKRQADQSGRSSRPDMTAHLTPKRSGKRG